MCRGHLECEVETLKPRAIVALGRKAFKQAAQLETEVPVFMFRHPSNGCPQLQSRVLDAGFASFAERAARRDHGSATSPEFVALRRSLQKELFPQSRLQPRT